jgi:hypothetical protein
MFRDLMERGTRNSYSPTLCLYVDEFGSCESPLVVKDILEKGRSCGIATVISMQDLNQLSISTNPAFVDSILGTINSCIIFAGATKTTAEQLSGVQIRELSDLLMTLTKPIPEEGRPPTAMFISKYPLYEKGGTEVYRFVPEVDEELLKATYSKRTTAATNTQNQPTVQPEQEQATTTGQPKQGIANMYDTPRIKRDNDFSGFDAENYL